MAVSVVSKKKASPLFPPFIASLHFSVQSITNCRQSKNTFPVRSEISRSKFIINFLRYLIAVSSYSALLAASRQTFPARLVVLVMQCSGEKKEKGSTLFIFQNDQKKIQLLLLQNLIEKRQSHSAL